MKPLVSILIPAYNVEDWIAETIQSAINQTWSRREIIVVDDGSTDATAAVARRFASKETVVVSTQNEGAAAARNKALRLCQGDYIQWLDADDLLAPDKIERQLAALPDGSSATRLLLSAAWAPFYYRIRSARFISNSLWEDLSPVDWLVRRMGENLYMQTATWLTSRALAEAAGPWDRRLLSDDDCEYFCRVLLASGGTRFVPEARTFYRVRASNRLSYIGNSDEKKEALLVSMKLHVKYLRSLEDSDRVRSACIAYLQKSYGHFYPERSDLLEELQELAAELHSYLEPPPTSWIQSLFGWKFAKRLQTGVPELKSSCFRKLDEAIYRLQMVRPMASVPPDGSSALR